MSIRQISDIFEQSCCYFCGDCDVNQYFSINDNFIEYKKVFYSFREVLVEALDFSITHENGSTIEICLDCKDKVIKFYHFKRKAKEFFDKMLNFQATPHQNKRKPPQREKQSKVVHNILKIVEDYTEKCAITTIRIDESNNKLIIEPAQDQNSSTECFPPSESLSVSIKEEPGSDFDESQLFNSEVSSLLDISDVLVKEEPVLVVNPLPKISLRTPADLQNLSIQRRRSRKSTTDGENPPNVSKAALKMRAYRERLKRPENFHRFLHHQQQQREWNKRHYQKKQETTRRQTKRRNQVQNEFGHAAGLTIFGANKFLK